jgi:hypothetical protein
MGEAPVVFAGPSLPRSPDAAERELLGRCDIRPPAQRGDLLAALAARPQTLVLLDGYYFDVPAVPHKEILYALDAGVRVIGAASLGALRAVEMEALGMIGVGAVFEQYRDGVLDGDDEVALLHAPAEHGYRPITVALVELRHAVALLTAAGAIAPDAGQRLIAAVKALSFLDRHPSRIAELARGEMDDGAARELVRLAAAGRLKQSDARRAIETALAAPDVREARRRPATGYIHFYKEAYLRCPPAGADRPSLQRAWRMAQLFHPEAPAFVREIRRRSLLVAAAERAGIAAPAGRLESRAEELRRRQQDLWGEPFLPEPEIHEEARFEILAEEAVRQAGGVQPALDALAKALGLPGADPEPLLQLATGSPESIPTWWLVRAFCLRPAFRPALETVEAAAEVHRCFLRWADGSRIEENDLLTIAAGLWACPIERVGQEATRRRLYASSALSEGLREALELVAAAERLPRAINEYPEKREALRRSALAAGPAS